MGNYLVLCKVVHNAVQIVLLCLDSMVIRYCIKSKDGTSRHPARVVLCSIIRQWTKVDNFVSRGYGKGMVQNTECCAALHTEVVVFFRYSLLVYSNTWFVRLKTSSSKQWLGWVNPFNKWIFNRNARLRSLAKEVRKKSFSHEIGTNRSLNAVR